VALLARIRAAIRAALGIVPTLDLHGLGIRAAVAATEDFLVAARERGERQVRIVYGKGCGSPGGRGVLREVIPHWLAGEGTALVTHFERQPDHSGADGGALVWLREPAAMRKPM